MWGGGRMVVEWWSNVVLTLCSDTLLCHPRRTLEGLAGQFFVDPDFSGVHQSVAAAVEQFVVHGTC